MRRALIALLLVLTVAPYAYADALALVAPRRTMAGDLVGVYKLDGEVVSEHASRSALLLDEERHEGPRL